MFLFKWVLTLVISELTKALALLRASLALLSAWELELFIASCFFNSAILLASNIASCFALSALEIAVLRFSCACWILFLSSSVILPSALAIALACARSALAFATSSEYLFKSFALGDHELFLLPKDTFNFLIQGYIPEPYTP